MKKLLFIFVILWLGIDWAYCDYFDVQHTQVVTDTITVRNDWYRRGSWHIVNSSFVVISSVATSVISLNDSGLITASSTTIPLINAFDSASSTIGTTGKTVFYGNGLGVTNVDADLLDGENLSELQLPPYLGDIFNSTPTYLNGISGPIIAKKSISVASYDVQIASATTDSFGIEISSKSLTDSSWTVVETITVTAGVSTQTLTSAGFTVGKGGRLMYGFTSVTDADPAGDIDVWAKD
jgi:hypothetical protein